MLSSLPRLLTCPASCIMYWHTCHLPYTSFYNFLPLNTCNCLSAWHSQWMASDACSCTYPCAVEHPDMHGLYAIPAPASRDAWTWLCLHAHITIDVGGYVAGMVKSCVPESAIPDFTFLLYIMVRFCSHYLFDDSGAICKVVEGLRPDQHTELCDTTVAISHTHLPMRLQFIVGVMILIVYPKHCTWDMQSTWAGSAI